MRASRLILISCCIVLAGSLAACDQALPKPFTSPLPASPTSALTTFQSPVNVADEPEAPPTALPAVRPSDTPDPAKTPLIIADAAIGDDGHEVVQIKNISAEKLDLSGHSLYNPLTEQQFDFPSGVELAPGETVEVHSGTSKEAATGGLFWTEEAVWGGENEDVLLLNPTGRLIFWYVFKH